eukprot:scaffold29915_cov90-Isochrysis_galbana.AAC.1
MPTSMLASEPARCASARLSQGSRNSKTRSLSSHRMRPRPCIDWGLSPPSSRAARPPCCASARARRSGGTSRGSSPHAFATDCTASTSSASCVRDHPGVSTARRASAAADDTNGSAEPPPSESTALALAAASSAADGARSTSATRGAPCARARTGRKPGRERSSPALT